ncbi:paralemmin-3 [Syngnathus scovelli]|uniref:paralemmin-3 n=1 Tax=Syngnathus scovelli TaxID=161590 RepID=UPI00211027D1|nr:paralemmin-3 [Syngnathus scovelli]XP_049575663.1 paralemmin-3 [Syngnathus scovelli]
MDEAEKYQQRLEAIAEKRRLQEEQERAKREMEDEKLRLQQLKRKSLRDQWLMEGAPLSPSSRDSQTPHSPPWAAQEMEKHRPPSRNMELAVEDVKEQIAEDQTEAANMDAGDMGTTAMQILRDDEAPVLMNGEGDLKAGLKQNHQSALEKSTTNGPSGSVVVIENHGQHILHLSSTEVDEGIVVMRAERVVITEDDDEEEEEEEEEEVEPQDYQKKEGGAVEEERVAPEASTELEKDETGAAAQARKTHEETREEDIAAETSPSTLLPSPTDPLEAASVAPVPVYSQSQPFSPPSAETPHASEEDAITPASATPDVSPKAQGDAPIATPRFQDVSLSDSMDNHRTEARTSEQEPLLVQPKGLEIQDDVASDNHSRPVEMRAEAMPAPNKKVCLCCSLM